MWASEQALELEDLARPTDTQRSCAPELTRDLKFVLEGNDRAAGFAISERSLFFCSLCPE